MNPKGGKTVYYFHFWRFRTVFLKGVFEKYRHNAIDITEVLITPKDHTEKEVGDNYLGNNVANFYSKFETPLKKVLKYNLKKELFQSIFNEGKHDWIDWGKHGGQKVSYIL